MKRAGITGLMTGVFACVVGVLAGCVNGAGAGGNGTPGAVVLVVTNHGELGDTGEPTGLFLSEATHPWAVFRDAGYRVVLASPEGGDAPIDPRSMKDIDSRGERFLERFAEGGVVKGTKSLAEIGARDARAIFFAGGHGAMWDFAENAQLKRVAEGIYASGGVVASVCHGPAALVGLKGPDGDWLVAEKKVTGFTNSEESAVGLTEEMPFLLETRLRERGARFVSGADFQEHVVVDGRLVTGQNPASAERAAEEVVALIGG